MTRINTIDVGLLTDQHLMAEYRELPMVNAALSRSLSSSRGVHQASIPSSYTLNRGHVTFFYDKGEWLYNRYQSLIRELRDRNYNIDPDSRVVLWQHFRDNSFYNNWLPDAQAHAINVERLLERIYQKKEWYRFHRSQLTESYIDRLKRFL